MCLRNREEARGAGGEAVRRREVAHEVISNEGWDGEGGPIREGLRPVWTLAFTIREVGSHWRARAEEGHELHSQFQERHPGCQVQDRLEEGKTGMLGLTSGVIIQTRGDWPHTNGCSFETSMHRITQCQNSDFRFRTTR